MSLKSVATLAVSCSLALTLGIGAGTAQASEPSLHLISSETIQVENTSQFQQKVAPNSTLSPEEEERLIEETARGLEIMFTKAATMDSQGNIVSVNMEALNEGLRDQGLFAPYGSSRDWDSFGQCIAKKIGITDAKEIGRIIFEPQVRQYLKNKAWRKASSIIVNNIKRYAGKKGASWAVKKLATKFLPGGLIGEIAVGAAWCGGKEAWHWWRG